MSHPSIFLGAKGPGRRSIEELRGAIGADHGYLARVWRSVISGAEATLGNAPFLPSSDIPGRPQEQIRHANADYTVCAAVVRRLLRDAVVYLLNSDKRYLQDSLVQLEAVFDRKRWPKWPDDRHGHYPADLRTGQLGFGISLTYDWLYESLSESERTMIVEGLDRCAIQPYLASLRLSPLPHWLDRHSNWQTVVVGGLGIVGMVLGSAHDESERLVEVAQPRMERYLEIVGPQGEFNESVGYSTAMLYPTTYWTARLSVTDGAEDRLAQHPFPQSCRWLMYSTVPPGNLIGFGDSHPRQPLHVSYFAAVAAATHDGVLQWFLETYSPLGRGEDVTNDPAVLDVLDLVWYDSALAPTPPADGFGGDRELPRGKAFPGWGGIVTSRSSWTDSDAVVVCGKAGREGAHEHNDDGQIIVDSNGVSLIVDLGSPSSYPADFFGENRARYYNASVRGHNVLQIGGREMRAVKPLAGIFLHTEFNSVGAAWSVDLTGAYDGAQLVRRSVIHLLPDVVAVLDECELERAEDVLLRWHTADRCDIDSQGSFAVAVEKDGATVSLLGQVMPLYGEEAIFRRGEQEYQVPFDRTFHKEPLEQRRESFVIAQLEAKRCRLLTLFSVVGTEAKPQWPPRQGGDGSAVTRVVPSRGGETLVTVDVAAFSAECGGASLWVPLAGK